MDPANLLILNKELCFSPGTISTVIASSHTLWCRCTVSVACAICPNNMWNLFVDGCPILMNGSLVHPQLKVTPKSATMYGFCTFRTFCLVLFSSHCFFVLLYIASCCLIIWCTGTGTLTHPSSGVLHVFISFQFFILAVMLLLLDSCPHHSWFPTFFVPSVFMRLLYMVDSFCLFFSNI